MKFACPKCSTRYSIADEKVPPAKTLRFPCKKCGNVIRLQRKRAKGAKSVPKKAAQESPPMDANATRVAPAAELNRLLGEAKSRSGAPIDNEATRVDPAATAIAGPEELKRLLGDAKVGGGQQMAADPGATKIASAEELNRAIAAARGEQKATDPGAAGDDDEWYVLVAGKQKGPISAAQVIDMLQRNEVDKRTYVWRDGMADWQRLGATAAFADLAERVGDAAWRVMTPVKEQRAPAGLDANSTVAMDRQQLEEQVERTRGSAGPEFEELDTRQMNGRAAMAADGQAAGDSDNTATLNDPAIIDALSGKPTGDGLTRSDSDSAAIASNSGARVDSGSFPVAPQRPDRYDEFDDPMTPARGRSALDEAGDRISGGDHPGPLLPLEESGETPVDDGVPSFTEQMRVANDDYFQAPPGESTRVFMATAGLYRRRRTHRIAAAVGTIFLVSLFTILALDIRGIIELPGAGMFYAKTGILDPNATRGISRVENQLSRPDLDPTQRAELEARRQKYQKLLLSTGSGPDQMKRAPGNRRRKVDRQGVRDTRDLKKDQRETLRDLFADERKSETKIRLAAPDRIEAPNLPQGLTEEAIAQVVKENGTSIRSCLAESNRKGEQLAGKMEMEVTISPNGTVSDVVIATAQFKRTAMGTCTAKRVSNWRFPRFNGEPVTVVLPYNVLPVF